MSNSEHNAGTEPRAVGRLWLFGLLYFALRLVFGWKDISRWGFPQAWIDLGFLILETAVVTILFVIGARLVTRHVLKRGN